MLVWGAGGSLGEDCNTEKFFSSVLKTQPYGLVPLKEEGGHRGAKRFTGRVGDALDLGRFPWGMKVGRWCFRMGGRRRGKKRRAKR